MITEDLITKIKAYSGANKDTDSLFHLTEEELDKYILEYYNSMEAWVNRKYCIPEPLPIDVEQILIELTSNLIRSHAVRQDIGINDHENFDFDEAVNNIFTEDIEKRMKPYTKHSKIHCFTIGGSATE